MRITWFAVLIICVALGARGAPSVKYDQRQEGDVNIRADLENFVILIIPTSNSGSMGLLDILTKSLPRKNAFKHLNKHLDAKNPIAPIPVQDDPIEHFIESKTAPYHVDISRTRSHLAKLHPNTQKLSNSEVLIAHSPTVSLAKRGEGSRSRRNVIIEAIDDLEGLVMPEEPLVQEKVTEKKMNNRYGENLTLLGAEMDQCGPDQKRDTMGICQLTKA